MSNWTTCFRTIGFKVYLHYFNPYFILCIKSWPSSLTRFCLIWIFALLQSDLEYSGSSPKLLTRGPKIEFWRSYPSRIVENYLNSFLDIPLNTKFVLGYNPVCIWGPFLATDSSQHLAQGLIKVTKLQLASVYKGLCSLQIWYKKNINHIPR